MTPQPKSKKTAKTSRVASKRKRSLSAPSDLESDEDPVFPTLEVKETRASKKIKTKNVVIDEGDMKVYNVGVESERDRDEQTDEKKKNEKGISAKVQKKPTETKRKWQQDCKKCVAENQTTEKFERPFDEDLVNVEESGKVYGIRSEDLATLPHCPVTNPHVKFFTASKFFMQADVENLAFRKEAVLAGVSQDDEDELLAQGQELFEDKHG